MKRKAGIGDSTTETLFSIFKAAKTKANSLSGIEGTAVAAITDLATASLTAGTEATGDSHSLKWLP